jgi:hypothetical protein
MQALLRAMRPGEWVKNLLVFAGLLFSGQLDEGDQVLAATLTFVAYCAISSAGYLFNDLRDREHDRHHPDKRERPLASGALSPATATGAAILLAAAAIALGLAVEPEVGGLVALYGAITAAYSLGLKRLVIIDVMTIGSLFILRVVAGAVAVEAQASEFLLICTGFLALFLGFTKRRQEAILEQTPATSSASRPGVPGGAGLADPEDPLTRPVLEHYSLPFLDQMIAMVTAASIISYVIYAANSPNAGSKMLITAPSVLYGIFRYLYLIYDRRDTRSTASILARDPGIVFAGSSWVATAVVALYALD